MTALLSFDDLPEGAIKAQITAGYADPGISSYMNGLLKGAESGIRGFQLSYDTGILTWESEFKPRTGIVEVRINPNGNINKNFDAIRTLAHEIRHSYEPLNREARAAFEAFREGAGPWYDYFVDRWSATRSDEIINLKLEYGFEELLNKIADNIFSRRFGVDQVEDIGAFTNLNFDQMIAAIKSGKITGEDVREQVFKFADIELSKNGSGGEPFSAGDGNFVFGTLRLVGEAFGAINDGIDRITTQLDPNYADYYDHPGDRMVSGFNSDGSAVFSAEHNRFVSQQTSSMGGWSPPPGYTIVPNGGGFAIVHEPTEDNPFLVHMNENANGRDSGGKPGVATPVRPGSGNDGGHDRSTGSGSSGGGILSSVSNAVSGFFNGLEKAITGKKPVLLDLDGNGASVAELGRSTVFLDSDGDGLKNRTAWAGVGDGVLFYDAGGDGKITEDREFVFTEWDPTAKDDMAALRSRFDSNGDGNLTGADTRRRGRGAGLTRRGGSRNNAVSRQGRGKTWLPASSRTACCISAIATSRARPITRPT